jgi:predicted nucleic acid-binding protein
LSVSKFVVDSYAILAFLQKEPGYGRIEALLRGAMNGEAEVHITAINLAEVHYHVLRRGRNAAKILAAIEALPLCVASADAYLPHVVDLKAKHTIPFPNCFAAALAQELHRPLITGDRAYRKLGESLEVEWLR